jgi:transcription elongation factor Elf1
MKVLRKGSEEVHDTVGDPENWTKKFSCTQCRSSLEVGIKDFTRVVYDQRDGNASVFNCPVCGKECWVAMSLIPASLHYLIEK